MENQRLGSLLDPFGYASSEYFTRYWTIFEKNNAFIPFDSLILLNRFIWIGISLLLLAFTFYRFNFNLLTGAATTKSSNSGCTDLL